MGQPKGTQYDNYLILMRKREHDTFSKVLEFFLIWYLLKLVVTRKHYIQNTAQKMKFSIKDFFSKRDQIRRKPLHRY